MINIVVNHDCFYLVFFCTFHCREEDFAERYHDHNLSEAYHHHLLWGYGVLHRDTHRDTRTGRGPSMSQTSSVRLWTTCQGRFLTWRENHWVDNVCERSWEDHPIILMFDHHFLITAISWWQITLFWWTKTQSVESSEAQRVAATTKRSSSSQKMSWVRPALVLWLEVDRGSLVFATFWTDSCTSVCGGKRANGGNFSADCWTLIVRPWQFESVISWGEYRLLHLSEVKISSEISRKFEGVRSQGLVGNVNSGRLSLSGGMAGVDKFLWLDARHRDSFPAFNGWKKAPEFLGKVPADADGSWVNCESAGSFWRTGNIFQTCVALWSFERDRCDLLRPPPQPRLKTIERICGERPGTRFRVLTSLRLRIDPPNRN